MNSKTKQAVGKLFVANEAQRMIFLYEMQGQISDGNWENARPHSHWIPWCDLKPENVRVGIPCGTLGMYPSRRNYNFADKLLTGVVGERIRIKIWLAYRYPKIKKALDKDNWIVPDSVHGFLDAMRYKDSVGAPGYWERKRADMAAAGITEVVMVDAQTSIDAQYPERQYLDDCRQLSRFLKNAIGQ